MNKELVLSTLEKMGYNVKLDSDGDINVVYQMKSIAVMVDEEEAFVSVLLPQFRMIDEDETSAIVAACNKITRETKLVKVYVDNSFKSVSASCEFYFANKSSLKQNLKHSLMVLSIIRSLFRDKYFQLIKD